MKRRTLFAIGGVAAIVGISAGIAFAENRDRLEDGIGGYGRHMGEGRGRGWGRRDMTMSDAMAKARARFARLDADSDGTLTRDEVTSEFGKRGERWRERRRGRRMMRRAQRMIRRFDADRDGRVTRAEFDNRINQRFDRVDLNGDGVITDADLPPFLRDRGILSANGERGPRWGRRRMRRMLGRLRRANTNGDDQVTREELAAFASKRFERWDQNKDGAIDAEDRKAFRAAMIDYRAQRFMHRFGAKGADTIDRDTFLAAAKARFERRDLDGNGVLDRRERRRGRWARWAGARRWLA